MTENRSACAFCGIGPDKRACMNKDGKGPEFCPTLNIEGNMDEIRIEAASEYDDPVIREFARHASLQEGSCYINKEERPYVLHAAKTRIQEICEFADRIEAKRLGLAFCMGLAREGRMFAEILTRQGFEVISVGCKAGRIPKEKLGVLDEEKIHIGEFESACNPILQAKILNASQTGLNILLGLCVGHDALFLKYAETLTTVLAVKDRVTGHNPLAPLYTSGSYYGYLNREGF